MKRNFTHENMILAMVRMAFHYNILNGDLSSDAFFDFELKDNFLRIIYHNGMNSQRSPSGPNGESCIEYDEIEEVVEIPYSITHGLSWVDVCSRIQEIVDDVAEDIEIAYQKYNKL
jgi:hypothetical protein